MDPTIAALDFDKAGAIIASMVESFLAGVVSETHLRHDAPPLNAKGAHNDDVQDQRSTSVTDGLRLHSTVDDGAGPLQSGEHRAPVQSSEQGADARLEAGADPGPGSRSRTVGDRKSVV